MHVIGTAGHVDHGKTSLITALTGINPDRLKEEQDREMTIELGFAWLTLPDGREVGIIDVPGHRDFIGNMLAGIGGIDAVLLVIAADEGVMPQTREHLAILELLNIHSGIIVLTKIDLVTDYEWLDLIEDDIRTFLLGTNLADAPIIRVSSRTKAGLDELISQIVKILETCPKRVDHGRPRLPVDRVFSIAGFGTVVTGTLVDGKFLPGDDLEILPSGKKGKIRGLQTHKKKEIMALPGSRTAINISNLSTTEVERGDVVIHPGQYSSSKLVDVHFHLLPDVIGKLKHNSKVKVYIGSKEANASIRVLGAEEIIPGEEGWLQLELIEPIVTVRGDRFILRRPSPSETLGGGSVLEAHPKSRHKRFSPEIILTLKAKLKGTPEEILIQTCQEIGPATIKDISIRSQLGNDQLQEAFSSLKMDGTILTITDDEFLQKNDEIIITHNYWSSISSKISQLVSDFHNSRPLVQGMPREELKSKLNLSNSVFNSLINYMVKQYQLIDKGSIISKPGFTVIFSPSQQSSINKLKEKFKINPFSPPATKECEIEIGVDVFNALLEIKELLKVSDDVVFQTIDYEIMVDQIIHFIEQYGQISVAEARDLFKTSRRYVLALLEYLDSIGLTTRDGDFRRLRR